MTIRSARLRHSRRRTPWGAAAAILVLALSIVADVKADPAADALAKLDELSQQALQSREAVTAAQRDLDARSAAQTAADERHRADVEALETANSRLRTRQAAVDRVAAMMYVSGHTGWLPAVLTAKSPQQLIDQMGVQRAVVVEMANQMAEFLSARDRAASAARASETSAAAARAAAERAAGIRAELQAKWSDLQQKILAAEAQYEALTPSQRAVIDNATTPPPPVPAAPAPADSAIVAMPNHPHEHPSEVTPPPELAHSDIPALEALPVGVASEVGLQPNTVLAARAISARFPQIVDIGGVRPDPKPWHPNGLAIDVMIPNPQSAEGIALGNSILDFVLSNAGRFGLQDAIWRGTYYTPSGPAASGYGHYDHIHVTTLPSR